MEGKTSLITLRYELLEYIIRLEEEKESILELAGRVNEAVEGIHKMELIKKRITDGEDSLNDLESKYYNVKRRIRYHEDGRETYKGMIQYPSYPSVFRDEIELMVRSLLLWVVLLHCSTLNT